MGKLEREAIDLVDERNILEYLRGNLEDEQGRFVCELMQFEAQRGELERREIELLSEQSRLECQKFHLEADQANFRREAIELELGKVKLENERLALCDDRSRRDQDDVARAQDRARELKIWESRVEAQKAARQLDERKIERLEQDLFLMMESGAHRKRLIDDLTKERDSLSAK